MSSLTSLKIEQPNKICILEAVQFVREKRTYNSEMFRYHRNSAFNEAALF